MEITLGLRPSDIWLAKVAEQFGTVPQSQHEFNYSKGSFFFKLYSLLIEPDKVAVVLGDIFWDAPLNTLRKSIESNDYWVLSFILSDEPHNCFLMNNNTRHQIKARKSTIFYSSKMAADTVWPVNKRSRFVTISFQRDWICEKLGVNAESTDNSPLISMLNSENGVYFHGVPLFERLVSFDTLFTDTRPLSWLLSVEAQCYELIVDFIGQLATFQSNATDHKFSHKDMKRVMEVESRYFPATCMLPSLEFLAGEANMSLSKFKKCFRHIYGAAPYEYHLNLKLDIARRLLLQNKWTIAEIANQLGYTSIASFNKVFKKKYNMNPTTLINEHSSQMLFTIKDPDND
ncbi:helix-turn-helix domain-containing protein [Runella slithyformis]|uniref:Transcriptional regulator, AraC family n=1 Tax=Runella slithyformis (strain ATCC 29530 / DSM 19594 / LMG 11500 / NCIMB 11436 / LSU 4) TaxID=761193 RepID=A0A7U3ZQ75_RUNSL|nr:helix-turn-helix domain-containing protein [Runella slithyformis]AEI51345.1 transcriptional regulator, AraC family [Runella slithyformis DSM 19594]